jgi:Cu/Ag efflux protein CusF
MPIRLHTLAQPVVPALVAGLLLVAPLAPVSAAEGHHAHSADHGAMHDAAQPSEGTVRKIDAAAGKVTIKHGPLDNLGMPPMTMAFSADAALLEGVKVGDKVRFVAAQVDGVFSVTSLEVQP